MALVLAPGDEAEVPPPAFLSAPELSAPDVSLTGPTGEEVGRGLVFVAPKAMAGGPHGPMIVDDAGELVWFRSLPEGTVAADFRVQRYEGEPVLTWWEGQVFEAGYGYGEFVIMDDSYREIARVEAGNGLLGDLHEFELTPDGSALIMAYPEVARDLSAVGGAEDGTILDGVVQEVDVESGAVLFEWRARDHVGLDESYKAVPIEAEKFYDYFHPNSIDVDRDGNLLVSARHTHSVYKIDRETGLVIWRLGGKESDFRMGPGTTFLSQHDARRRPDGTLTIFDNDAPPETNGESRGIVLDLDQQRMRVTLAREYLHQNAPLARSQGNLQSLPGGNVFMGYGSEAIIAEFSRDGRLLFDARLPEGYDTYRAFRLPWEGRPADPPAIAAEPGDGGEMTVYASWNGATEVAKWQVLAGPEPGDLSPAGSADREGFETAIGVETSAPFVAVRALDDSGEELAISEVVELDG